MTSIAARCALGAALVLAALLAVAGCSGGHTSPAPGATSSAPIASAALRLIPAVWRVEDAAGESADTWIRFDTEIDLIRPKGEVNLDWSTQEDRILTAVTSWSMSLGTTPPAVPWLTSTTRFAADGDGWVLTDAQGRRTARLVRDGAPPTSDRALRTAPKLDAFLRGLHTDAVPGAEVRPVASTAADGTWGLPGVAAKDGSVTISASGRWSTRSSCQILGDANGGAGAFGLLPDGTVLATAAPVAGVGCAPDPPSVPKGAKAVLEFFRVGSVAVDGARMTVYDRQGRALGTLERKS